MKENGFIGQFKVKSNKLRVSDPYYEKDTWCAGVIEDVKSGIWEANIKTTQGKVSELIILHSNIKNDTLKKSKWFEHDIEIGVDSSLCGIFDDEYYPEKKDEEDTFYEKCCTSTKKGVGLLDFGVVTSSGWGEGSYLCYTLEEKKDVVGVKVIFIEDDDLNEDYDDEDDDIYDDYLEEDE